MGLLHKSHSGAASTRSSAARSSLLHIACCISQVNNIIRDVDIRVLEFEDVSCTAKLLANAFAPPNGYNALQQKIILSETESGLAARLGKSQLLVAEYDGDIVGSVEAFTPAFLEGKAIRFWNESLPLDTYISALAVAPSWRRAGVASSLIEAVERRAWDAGEGCVSLQVDATNTAAVALYEHLGYAVVGYDRAVTTPSSNALMTSLVFGGGKQRSLLVLQKQRPKPPQPPQPPAAGRFARWTSRTRAVLGRVSRLRMSASPPPPVQWAEVLIEQFTKYDAEAVRRAAASIAAPSWEDIGSRLPERERELQAIRQSGRGPTDVAADLRLFELAEGAAPRVVLWRDQSAWCPYCHKVMLQLEEKRVPYSVRRAPMKCYAGGALQKPAEFLELSKAGTLPVAVIDGELYPDSASILAAIEREFPDHPSLMPSTELGRRTLEQVGVLEQSFSSAWLVWLTTPPWLPGDAQRATAFTDSLDAIDAHLRAMSTLGVSAAEDSQEGPEDGAGPYLLGATFSLADVKMAPFMERAAASMPYYRGLTIRTGGRWPAIEKWFAAMEARPVYAALRGDFYTHALDLPPQLSPFGLGRSADADAQRYAAEIDGSDGVSWGLPLPRAGQLEPLPGEDDDSKARVAAAAALWRNAEQVASFACRGRGIRAVVRLPAPTALAIAAVVALAINGALQGSAASAFQWSATALVMYDILGTRAPLADPRAIPARTLSPLVDASLRLTASAMLAPGSDAQERMRDAQRQLSALDPEAAAPLHDALLYLRARIGVPRDMSYAEARQARAHLTACMDALSSD